MKIKYELKLEEIKNTEIVHFSANGLLVTSFGRTVRIIDSLGRFEFDLPVKLWLRPFYKFRLIRRFLRLDKMNVFMVSASDKEMVVIYQGIIYSYSNLDGLQHD